MDRSNLIAEVYKKPGHTAFGDRYIEFLQAGLEKAVLESVNFNVVAYQEKNGTLRIDRTVPAKREKMTREYFQNRESVIMMNESDAQVLKQLAEFKAENSLDMEEVGEQWFEYIIAGQVGSKVAEML